MTRWTGSRGTPAAGASVIQVTRRLWKLWTRGPTLPGLTFRLQAVLKKRAHTCNSSSPDYGAESLGLTFSSFT